MQLNIQVSSFSTSSVDLTLFHDSTFKFTQFNIQVYAIQHSSLRNSTFKFTQFNIQVYAIQHSSLRNSTFKFTQFNIQVYAIQHPSLRNSTSNFRRCMFSISNRKPVNDNHMNVVPRSTENTNSGIRNGTNRCRSRH